MERKAFTFLRSFYEAACEIKDKTLRADFFMAICNYALNGEEPECTGEVKALFILIKPVLDVSQIRSECGAIGGRKNKKRIHNKTEASDNQTESQKEANSEQTESPLEGIYEYEYEYENDIKDSSPKNEPKKGTTESQIGSNEPKKSPFDTFWDEYPNRKGKPKAREAFKKAIKKTTLETMLSAIQKQKHSSQWTRDNGQYIPYPATWLNQERWDDEVDTNGSGTGHSDEPGLQRLEDWEQQHTL